jgi:hypothetical protein
MTAQVLFLCQKKEWRQSQALKASGPRHPDKPQIQMMQTYKHEVLLVSVTLSLLSTDAKTNKEKVH